MKGKSQLDSDEERDFYSNPLLTNPYFSNSKSWGDRDRDMSGSNYPSAPILSPPMGSVEIKGEAIDEEIEPRSAAICRICLHHDVDSGARDELIAPCLCKGSQQFVHRSCLDHWRSVREGFAFCHCTTCKAQYHLQINFLEGNCWRTIKFRMFVTRDIILGFLAVQALISMLGGLSYLCDLGGSFRKSIGHGWDRIFSNHPVLFYYCLGALVFFALLGIFGLLQQCSSYGRNNYDYDGYSSETSIYCCNGPYFVDCDCSRSDSGNEFCAVVLVFVIIFAVIGIFYGMFAASVGIQRVWQRHYHIVTKMELTKEYVVEDLHGHYTPPRLDREHEEHLRKLKLL